MDLKLNNKIALVIGASKGIGRSVASLLAKEGCNVIAVARSKDLLKELQKENKNINIEIYDVISEPIKFANEINNKYPHIDIIVHCVGTSLTPRDIFDEWDTSLSTNALHQIKINSILIPNMIKQGIKGHICHISSISSKNLRGNPQYACAKEFLNSYITTSGRILAKEGIVVNGIMPGVVSFKDSYWDKAIKDNDPKVKDYLSHYQGLGRFATPEEIAPLVVFLVSDLASYTSGDIMPIDGAGY